MVNPHSSWAVVMSPSMAGKGAAQAVWMQYIEQAGITLSTEMTRGRGIYYTICGVVGRIPFITSKKLYA
jgi:hypothetical protein